MNATAFFSGYVPQDGALFHRKCGLGSLPLALFNGIPLNPDEMDPDELEAVILQRIMDTTTAFQRAVFMVDTLKTSPLIFIQVLVTFSRELNFQTRLVDAAFCCSSVCTVCVLFLPQSSMALIGLPSEI